MSIFTAVFKHRNMRKFSVRIIFLKKKLAENMKLLSAGTYIVSVISGCARINHFIYCKSCKRDTWKILHFEIAHLFLFQLTQEKDVHKMSFKTSQTF